MNVNLDHLLSMRSAYAENQNEGLVDVYCDMVNSLKPNITKTMINSTVLVIEGNTGDEAAEILGVTKVAVSQNSIKGFNRLAEFWVAIGGELHSDLEFTFNVTVAKRHLDFFDKAVKAYQNPSITITW